MIRLLLPVAEYVQIAFIVCDMYCEVDDEAKATIFRNFGNTCGQGRYLHGLNPLPAGFPF